MTARDLAKEWLRYAKSDLNTAVHMFNDVNPKEIEISCYHAQQCAEKSLKAYLILKEIDPPRIHDLLETMNLRVIYKPSSLFEKNVAFTGFLDMPGYSIDDCRELVVKYTEKIKKVVDGVWGDEHGSN
ncbi:MAG: HEPN domain-containing protein [Treponema sp.]|jgi:HEPN domain-containing protein|nr:HEPN domain-containing protein [Treponema sp.]